MHYNQSWAMIHFLIHGDGGKHRSLLGKYLSALKKGKNQKQAFDRVFGNTDFSRLESRLISHFTNMKDE